MTFKEYRNVKHSIPLFEGIEIDTNNKIVRFTDEHENYVDASLGNNPSDEDEYISVFQRKKTDGVISDGNPLIYALKGLKAWGITKEDTELISNRIKEILNKIEDNFDILVLSPSSNSLVSVFAEDIKEKFPKAKVFNSCLSKRTKEEIQEIFPFQNFSEQEMEKIDKAFSKMDYWFESKHFPKDLAKKMETNIVKIDDSFSEGLEILGKRVLVVDDVVFSGWGLSSCAKDISENYFPESVKGVVMFGVPK